jgi:hypothetical protein
MRMVVTVMLTAVTAVRLLVTRVVSLLRVLLEVTLTLLETVSLEALLEVGIAAIRLWARVRRIVPIFPGMVLLCGSVVVHVAA